MVVLRLKVPLAIPNPFRERAKNGPDEARAGIVSKIRRGRLPPKDDRIMVCGIYNVRRTGVPGRDFPWEFGPWSSVYTRFRRWCRTEPWAKMLALLANPSDKVRSVDCTHIKVH